MVARERVRPTLPAQAQHLGASGLPRMADHDSDRQERRARCLWPALRLCYPRAMKHGRMERAYGSGSRPLRGGRCP
jgi:hypothetical protein